MRLTPTTYSLAAAIAIPDPVKSYHEIAARDPQGDIADRK